MICGCQGATSNVCGRPPEYRREVGCVDQEVEDMGEIRKLLGNMQLNKILKNV